MSSFWGAYPTFVPHPTKALRKEFNRLASQQRWNDNQKRKKWLQCAQKEFLHQFGDDEKSLAGWQAMCAIVEVDEIPESISRCKRLLKDTVWVNIYDLLDAKRTGSPPKKHRSAGALAEYCRQTDKIFPKRKAKANPFLRVLLVEVF
ncbi:hypothetical protein R3P38DRAFT_3420379, partial [Favolaschia claudopus]